MHSCALSCLTHCELLDKEFKEDTRQKFYGLERIRYKRNLGFTSWSLT